MERMCDTLLQLGQRLMSTMMKQISYRRVHFERYGVLLGCDKASYVTGETLEAVFIYSNC